MNAPTINLWLKKKFAGYLGAMVFTVPLFAGAALGMFAVGNAADRRDGLIPTIVTNLVAFVLYLFILKMKPDTRLLFMSKRVWIVLFLIVYCGGYLGGMSTSIS